nr:helix-turn-helix transcriptional regulator [uncultured Streptococcus sp.]
MTSFSDRLKELRKKNRLTQQELADKVGTNRVNITKWETGRTEPTLANIVKLSKILDTTTDELLGRKVNFGDRIIFDISKYDLSNLKNFSEQEIYDLKATIVLELLDESTDTLAVKNRLTIKNKLDKDEEIILDALLTEAKVFADEVIAFEKFRKAQRKFKWPWQKDNNNLTTTYSNNNE